MSSNAARRPLEGIFVPTITIFKDTKAQEIDVEAHRKHILYLAHSGVNGVLIQGSTGEQVSLTKDERIQACRTVFLGIVMLIFRYQLTQATRAVTEESGFHNFTIMAGTGAQSTQEAIVLAKDAASAGADYACVLPPSFFAPSMTADALESFYLEVTVIFSNFDLFLLPPSGCRSISDPHHSLFLARGLLRFRSHLGWHCPSRQTLKYHGDKAGKRTHVLAQESQVHTLWTLQTDHNVGKMARNVYQNADFYVLAGASDYLVYVLLSVYASYSLFIAAERSLSALTE